MTKILLFIILVMCVASCSKERAANHVQSPLDPPSVTAILRTDLSGNREVAFKSHNSTTVEICGTPLYQFQV